MPYIISDTRPRIYDLENATLDPWAIFTAGQLNYLFTIAITSYISNNKLSYQTINDVVGALEGSKLEFYRRVAVPYEEKKIDENGDVY